ncbi:hypothetical protein [Providencia rettgeri]|uniref:hypothetical protein n=2 Tax=Providencia rettgeri TaxID=587 RepID=UPI001D0D5537|nr:hypothetical protein [Providencia rettgeri]MCB6144821.1 hypothetical protein [Providencia rettgeri]UDQ69298.1 hypothetical protein LHK11_11960 [Providencia rettgeri]
MERPDNTQRNRKCSMRWEQITILKKPIAPKKKKELPIWASVAIVILLSFFSLSLVIIGAVRSVDNTCGIDKVSLEKRCQKAIDHYKGRQVNL